MWHLVVDVWVVVVVLSAINKPCNVTEVLYTGISACSWGLIAVEYIKVDRTSVNAYSIRIKL